MSFNYPTALKLLYAVPVIVLSSLVLYSSYGTLLSLNRVKALESGSLNAANHAQSLKDNTTVHHPQEWIATATQLTADSSEQDGLSIELLQRALASSPHHPHAWALLSFLQARHAKAFDDQAESSLQKSFAYCPYCDRALLRWRFTFALQHWEKSNEETRMAAFSGADFLRWWYLDYEFLSTVRDAALLERIPFDEYRRRVNTPVRPNELR
ncbi:MAG: hypothetical protein Hens2KO_15980 [Henriciella sp.]